jgi:glutamine phosphoribosylpyrophosphate amidotransferase
MCGIFGISLFNENSNAFKFILNGINLLQHRGQDAAGISTCKNKSIFTHKGVGKVDEVFKNESLKEINGPSEKSKKKSSSKKDLSFIFFKKDKRYLSFK